MSTVKISPTGDTTAEVTIDGTDIADAVRGLTLTMAPDQLPRLIVDLNVFVEPIEAADAQIVVPEQTVKALEALGWLPPDMAAQMCAQMRRGIAEEIEAECIDAEWPNDEVSANGARAAAIARGDAG